MVSYLNGSVKESALEKVVVSQKKSIRVTLRLSNEDSVRQTLYIYLLLFLIVDIDIVTLFNAQPITVHFLNKYVIMANLFEVLLKQGKKWGIGASVLGSHSTKEGAGSGINDCLH